MSKPLSSRRVANKWRKEWQVTRRPLLARRSHEGFLDNGLVKPLTHVYADSAVDVPATAGRTHYHSHARAALRLTRVQ